MLHIGILAHSADGAALCFLEMVRESARRLGVHAHPEITLSILPMGAALEGYERGDLAAVRAQLARTAQRLATAGCDFFVCPDNTAHIALELPGEPLPLPGLHIADIVARRAAADRRTCVGLLGTRWTMEGPVYPAALARHGVAMRTPPPADRALVDDIIFSQLCQGLLTEAARAEFVRIIEGFKRDGCDCVALSCTEIPLLITPEASPLPTLDSTRLLAAEAVAAAIARRTPVWCGQSDLQSANAPETIIDLARRLREERYAAASAVFAAGSLVRGEGTAYSDLDLVVVYPEVECAYRESFLHTGLRVEAFVHDPETMNHFFCEFDRPAGIPALAQMVLEGVEIPGPTDTSRFLKEVAASVLTEGPPSLSDRERQMLRYTIGDLLDDMRAPRSRAELSASGSRLFEALADYYLRTRRLWSARGKSIPRALMRADAALGRRYSASFDELFSTGDARAVIQLAEELLRPDGGPLFEGYRLDAPAEWRKPFTTAGTKPV